MVNKLNSNFNKTPFIYKDSLKIPIEKIPADLTVPEFVYYSIVTADSRAEGSEEAKEELIKKLFSRTTAWRLKNALIMKGYLNE